MKNMKDILIKLLTSIYDLDSFFYNNFCRKAPFSERNNLFYKYFPNQQVDYFFHIITKLGEGYLEIFILLYFLYFLFFKNKKKYKAITLKFALLSISVQIILNIFKMLFGRLRPYVSPEPDKFYGIFYLIQNDLLFNSKYYSFPSGHTITIWGTIWFFIFLKKRKISAILLPLGVLVAISRIYLGYHWFSDTLGAILLSYLLTKLVFKIFDRFIENKKQK